MKRLIWVGTAIAASALGLVLGSRGSTAQPGPTYRQAVVVASPETIPPNTPPDIALQFSPPSPGYVPPTSAEDAIGVAALHANIDTATSVQPVLGLLTDPLYRPTTAEGDPTGPPFWINVPTWDVVIEGLCFGQEGGGFTLPGQSPQPADACPNTEMHVFVDARTGAYMMDYSYR